MDKGQKKAPHCLYDPTQKHAFYLGLVGVILEGGCPVFCLIF